MTSRTSLWVGALLSASAAACTFDVVDDDQGEDPVAAAPDATDETAYCATLLPPIQPPTSCFWQRDSSNDDPPSVAYRSTEASSPSDWCNALVAAVDGTEFWVAVLFLQGGAQIASDPTTPFCDLVTGDSLLVIGSGSAPSYSLAPQMFIDLSEQLEYYIVLTYGHDPAVVPEGAWSDSGDSDSSSSSSSSGAQALNADIDSARAASVGAPTTQPAMFLQGGPGSWRMDAYRKAPPHWPDTTVLLNSSLTHVEWPVYCIAKTSAPSGGDCTL